MQEFKKPLDLLRSIHSRQKISGQRLLNEFRALPRIKAIRLPQGVDDSDDIVPILMTLTDTKRVEFGFGLQVRPVLPTPLPRAFQPVYRIRVHAILCANDDGSGGAADPNAVDANYIKEVLDTTNVIYQSAGIQFVYRPTTDFERINSSLLNLDFTVPTDLNFDLPESQPPLTDKQIEELAKPHGDERQRVGRQYHYKMVLLFCDGNELIFDKTQGRWVLITRRYAFSSGEGEFVALPACKGDLQGFANLVAHESGHYFHQLHTHAWKREPADEEEAATFIRDAVEKYGYSVEDGLKIFDGDGLIDTPPDASNGLFDHVYGSAGCGIQDVINIPVIFSDGTKKEYSLKPDRGNVMSYFKHCTNIPMHFSPEQIAGMRCSLEKENRQHLIQNGVKAIAIRDLGRYPPISIRRDIYGSSNPKDFTLREQLALIQSSY